MPNGALPDKPPGELARAIIGAEYAYVAQTAFQANEDRARAWQYFFVTFATLIAALLSTQIEGIDRRQLYLTFVVIFALLAGLGLITILQLVRLRQAWLESVQAMNQIKARLMADDPALAAYFRWTTATVPPAFKLRSFGFLQAVSVALLSGLAVGAPPVAAQLRAGRRLVSVVMVARAPFSWVSLMLACISFSASNAGLSPIGSPAPSTTRKR